MRPEMIQLRYSVEKSANDLNRICSTMEILLASMYESSEEANPVREAMALLWENTIEVRDRLLGSCIDSGFSWKETTA